jgi:hypothetical protein
MTYRLMRYVSTLDGTIKEWLAPVVSDPTDKRQLLAFYRSRPADVPPPHIDPLGVWEVQECDALPSMPLWRRVLNVISHAGRGR